MPKKKATSSDVARKAGVSQATVSMVLNKKYNVSFSRETVEKVEQAARELGYQLPGRKNKKDSKQECDIEIDGVVLTMRDSRSNLGKQVAGEISKFFADSIFETTIPRNVRLAESPSYGEPICLYDKSCVGAKAYKALTEEYFDRRKEKYIKI